MENEVIKQQQESIKLSKMSKGKYQWEIRVFLGDVNDTFDLDRLDRINKELERRYGNGE